MKKVCTLFLFCVASCLFSGIGRSQVRFEDNFDYPTGDSLRGHGWNLTGSVVNPVSVTSPGLSYTGYPSSGIGNAVALQNNGQDVHDTLTSPVTSGTVYASLLVRVTAAQAGDYFFHLTTTTAPTSAFFTRTFVRLASNSNLTFGIQKGTVSATNPVAYTDSVYSLNTTYLLVVKYVFNTGTTTDDLVSLFVFTDPTLPSTEPGTPAVGPITSTVTDATGLGLVALRQGAASTAPTMVVDGIRVGLTWNDAPLPIQLSYFRGTYSHSNNSVQLDWRTISEVNNYGFFVQRSSDRVTVSVVSSLIPGHGTTNVPQSYTFTDLNVPSSNWYYRLKQIDLDGSVNYTEWIMVAANPTSVNENGAKVFALQQNYPNPFNPETHIKFSVEKTGRASLRVFDIVGREVANLFDEVAEAGKYYDLTFRGTNLTSGVYFYKLESGTAVAMKKLMLLK